MWKGGHFFKNVITLEHVKNKILQVTGCRSGPMQSLPFDFICERQEYTWNCTWGGNAINTRLACTNNNPSQIMIRVMEKPAGVRPYGPERCCTAAPATPLLGLRLCPGDNPGIWDLGPVGSGTCGIWDLWDVRVELHTDDERSTNLLGVIYLEATVTGAHLLEITQISIKIKTQISSDILEQTAAF